MTFRQFVPPALDGRDIFRDPIALKWEARFLEYFVSRMKRHPAIFAWESGNESNHLSEARVPEEAWVWIKYIHGIIRENDGSRPVIGVQRTERNVRKWTELAHRRSGGACRLSDRPSLPDVEEGGHGRVQ